MERDYKSEPRRVIDIAADMRGYSNPKPVEGTPPEVKLIPVGQLYLDHSYQRMIRNEGRKNIQRIVSTFDWRHYQPLLVAKLDDESYTVIDGQHRALAACLHPEITHVPCSVVEADFTEQAKVFLEINTQVVKMLPLEKFWAEYHAGRKWALDTVELIHSADMFVAKRMPKEARPNISSDAGYQAYSDEFVFSIWVPSTVHRIMSAVGYNPTLISLSFLRELPDDPSVANSYLIEAFAIAFKERGMTSFGDSLPDDFAAQYSWEDIRVEVAKITTSQICRTRPALIAYQQFVKPFFDTAFSQVARIEAA